MLALWAAAYSSVAVSLFAIPRITEVVQAVETVDPASFGYGSAEGGAGVAFMSVTVTTAIFFGAALARYTRLLRRRSSEVLIAVMVGLVLFLDAELAMMYSNIWNLSWWLYHVFMLCGFAIIAYGILLEYRRHKTLGSLFDGITVRDAIERIQENYNEATTALVAAVEAKDSYTRGHSARLSDYAVTIVERFGLARADLDRIRHAAVLHDIGKIAVGEQILTKDGGLSDAERDAVQQHPSAGNTMVMSVPSLLPCVPGIRGHHERYDGAGYPDGLSGDRISLDARIIAVADVYDALTSDRSYRPALSIEVSTRIIREGSGTHFDPRCVEAFMTTGLAFKEMDPESSVVTDNDAGV